MKKFTFLLALAVSISARSQIFIGKTQEEIIRLNLEKGNKLTENHNDSLFTALTYTDNKYPVSYMYVFNKSKICMEYSITTQDKSIKDSILGDIEKKCQEKLTDRAWVQKLDGKNYGWRMMKGNHDVCTFSTTQLK
jgi:hypothetical protein